MGITDVVETGLEVVSDFVVTGFSVVSAGFVVCGFAVVTAGFVVTGLSGVSEPEADLPSGSSPK